MDLILGIIFGLLVLGLLVLVHEGGHAWAARHSGVVVEEFAIGFPPTIASKKSKSGINFKLNSVPLGGYVKLQGEHDSASKKGDYGAASLWSKTKILFAGVMMNLLLAVILFTITAWIGMPELIPNQFQVASDSRVVTGPVRLDYVAENSPAARAGLEFDDQIVQINDLKITNPNQIGQQTEANKGQVIKLTFLRDGQERTEEIQLNADRANGQGYLGTAQSQVKHSYSTWSAPVVGVGTTVQLMAETYKSLGGLLVNSVTGFFQRFSPDQTTKQIGADKLAQASNSVAGPIGILGVIFPALIGADFSFILAFIAVISLSLAAMNTLPIPALDGGRWLVTMLFRLAKKPLTKEREENIQVVGVVMILALTLIVTISDITKFF